MAVLSTISFNVTKWGYKICRVSSVQYSDPPAGVNVCNADSLNVTCDTIREQYLQECYSYIEQNLQGQLRQYITVYMQRWSGTEFDYSRVGGKGGQQGLQGVLAVRSDIRSRTAPGTTATPWPSRASPGWPSCSFAGKRSPPLKLPR